MMQIQQQKYRSRIEIIGDILDAAAYHGQDGINISSISRKTNLSHYTAIKKCDSLVSAGLIESKRTPKKVRFTITNKGIQFFQEFKKFQYLLQQVNLEC